MSARVMCGVRDPESSNMCCRVKGHDGWHRTQRGLRWAQDYIGSAVEVEAEKTRSWLICLIEAARRTPNEPASLYADRFLAPKCGHGHESVDARCVLERGHPGDCEYSDSLRAAAIVSAADPSATEGGESPDA